MRENAVASRRSALFKKTIFFSVLLLSLIARTHDFRTRETPLPT
jgi:hypothetical protein